MRTQWRAIKKVKREVGVGFDTLQYHFFCCKNALSSDELQQLLDVIGASDKELGLKSAWTAAIMIFRSQDSVRDPPTLIPFES